MNKTNKTKRSVFSWLSEFAKGRRGEYLLSVITALIGVACSLIPYFIIKSEQYQAHYINNSIFIRAFIGF